MRFSRITPRPGSPRDGAAGRNVRAEAHAEPASPRSAARADRSHVKPSSYVALSLLFSTLLFGFFLVNDRGFLQVRRQRQRLVVIQAEVSALALDNERLEAEVKALRTDPNAVERTAREDLNLVKPDEVVLVLPPKWRERVAAGRPGSAR